MIDLDDQPTRDRLAALAADLRAGGHREYANAVDAALAGALNVAALSNILGGEMASVELASELDEPVYWYGLACGPQECAAANEVMSEMGISPATDLSWPDLKQGVLDFARSTAADLAEIGHMSESARLYEIAASAEAGPAALEFTQELMESYRDVVDLTGAQFDTEVQRASEDQAEAARRRGGPAARRSQPSTEDRLARAYQRIEHGTYTPQSPLLEFASPSSAARELARRRWQVSQPGGVTGRANCGASDEFGYCISPQHDAGCGSVATTEIAEGLQAAGAYARLAGMPLADANGRFWVDQYGRPMTAAGHIEAATGQRLGGGASFETGAGKRELTAPQRQPVFGDYDDPGDPGSGVPYETAATAAAVREAMGLPDRGAAARERDRFTQRRTEAVVGAVLGGRGLVRRPDDAFDVTGRRERIAEQRGAVQPVQVSEPWNGSLPQFEAG